MCIQNIPKSSPGVRNARKISTAVKSVNRELRVNVNGFSALQKKEALLRLEFQLSVHAMSSGGYSRIMVVLVVRI